MRGDGELHYESMENMFWEVYQRESQQRWKARITKMKKEDEARESKNYQENRGLRVAL